MELIKKNPLTSYFLIVFAIMYAAGLIVIFKLVNIPFILWAILGSAAPTITAIIVLKASKEKGEVKKLFKKFLIWKVGIKYYLAAILITILSVLVSITYLIYNNLPIPSTSIVIIIVTLLFSFIMGPLIEEAGWSGFALPRLQSKFTPFKASLILGILWAVWHLPLWFIPGTAQSSMSFPMFFIILIALRFIMAWAYNNTNGSLLIAIMFHGFFNFGNAIGVGILKVPMNSFLYLAGTVLIIYSAIVLIKTKNLSAGKKITI